MLQIIGSLPGLEELPAPVAGFSETFRGCKPGDGDEPDGEYVQVDLVIPPLNLGSVKRLLLRGSKQGRSAAEMQAEAIDLICQALKRNYRNVPLWLIEQSFDNEHFKATTEKLLEISGLTPKKAVPAASEPPPTSPTGLSESSAG